MAAKKGDRPASSRKGSAAVTGAILLLLTVVAGGGGAFLGTTLAGAALGRVDGRPTADAPSHEPLPSSASEVSVRELAPVITNLAAPPSAWIRLQAAIVFDKKAVPNPDVTAAEITDDISAFLKTMSLAQIQGSLGLQGLREDLNERATLRSGGKVRELVIEMLVVQ